MQNLILMTMSILLKLKKKKYNVWTSGVINKNVRIDCIANIDFVLTTDTVKFLEIDVKMGFSQRGKQLYWQKHVKRATRKWLKKMKPRL